MAYCHTVVYVTIFVYISIYTQAVPFGHPAGEPIKQNVPGTEIPPVHNVTLQPDVNVEHAELNQDTDIGDSLNTGKMQLDLENMLRKTALERRRALVKRKADRYHARCCYVDVFCIRGCRKRSRNGFF